MGIEQYLISSTGRVESICSAYKQGVIILLEKDLDEIVAFILQKGKQAEKRTRKYDASVTKSALLKSRARFFVLF